MTAFEGFSEAAQLYAENVVVVNEMQKLCRSEILRLLDALHAEIQGLVAPHHLQTYWPSENSRYWWIAEPQQDRDDFARLSIDVRNPEIARPIAELLRELSALGPLKPSV